MNRDNRKRGPRSIRKALLGFEPRAKDFPDRDYGLVAIFDAVHDMGGQRKIWLEEVRSMEVSGVVEITPNPARRLTTLSQTDVQSKLLWQRRQVKATKHAVDDQNVN